jgi:hypothetical protein
MVGFLGRVLLENVQRDHLDTKGNIDGIGSNIALFTRATRFNPHRDNPANFLGSQNPHLRALLGRITRTTTHISNDRKRRYFPPNDTPLRRLFTELSILYQSESSMTSPIIQGVYDLTMHRVDLLQDLEEERKEMIKAQKPLEILLAFCPRQSRLFRDIAVVLD